MSEQPGSIKSKIAEEHVCSWRHAYMLDNFIREWIHNPRKLFAPYVEKGMNLIDIGCGRGFISLALAGLVGETGRVTAADLQPEMLSMVKERVEKKRLSNIISTHQCRKRSIGAEGPFDFAVSFYMVHETPDPGAFLNQVYDILERDGLYYIAEPSFHVTDELFEETLSLARETGFTVYDRPGVRFSRAVVLKKS